MNKIQRFRKKPVEIEAVKFVYTTECLDVISEFMGIDNLTVSKARCIDAKAELVIPTLEDGSKHQVTHIATEGDWIIKGVDGEFYACQSSIFERTYDET